MRGRREKSDHALQYYSDACSCPRSLVCSEPLGARLGGLEAVAQLHLQSAKCAEEGRDLLRDRPHLLLVQVRGIILLILFLQLSQLNVEELLAPNAPIRETQRRNQSPSSTKHCIAEGRGRHIVAQGACGDRTSTAAAWKLRASTGFCVPSCAIAAWPPPALGRSPNSPPAFVLSRRVWSSFTPKP